MSGGHNRAQSEDTARAADRAVLAARRRRQHHRLRYQLRLRAARDVDGHRVPEFDAHLARPHPPCTLSQSTPTWRASPSPALYHASYALIIAAELLTGVLCVFGAWRLWNARAYSAVEFNGAKDIAIAGLVCGFALWFFGFIAVGGEWFQIGEAPNRNRPEAS